MLNKREPETRDDAPANDGRCC